MYISSTNTAANGYLTSLLDSTVNTITSSTAVDFGASSILSLLDQSTDTSGVNDGYSNLINLQHQLGTQPTAQVSSKQAKAEQEIVEHATALRINEQYDAARELLEGLLEKNRTNAVAIHGLGAIELDQGNYEKAERYFNKAHYLDPGYGFDRDATNAKILRQDDDYVLKQARRMTAQEGTRDDGVRLLVSLTKRSSGNAIGRTMLAENLILQGDPEQGLIQYQMAISTADESQLQVIESKLATLTEANPEAAYLQNLLGQTELKLGKHEQAAETLALASRLSDHDPLYLADEALAHAALGNDALERGDRITALSEFKTALELDSSSDEVNLGMAKAYLAQGEYRARVGDPTRALADFNTAKSYLGEIEDEELTEDLAAAFYSAGRTLERRRESAGGEIDGEVAAYQAAYELDPENLTYKNKLAETQVALGDQYLAEGDYKNAAYAYQYAYEVDDEDSYRNSAIDAFMNWGNERSDAYDHHQAITAFQAAYDLDHDNETSKTGLAEAFNTRGLFYMSLGEDFYEQAAADFEAALDLYPDNEGYQDNYDLVTNDYDL